MAIRYSGNMQVQITYLEPSGEYRCRVRAPGRQIVVYVKTGCVEFTVPIPKPAYDIAARNAIRAADREIACCDGMADDEFSRHALLDDDGTIVIRRKLSRVAKIMLAARLNERSWRSSDGNKGEAE